MKYYDNGIYPVALVLSNDIESVRKEYLLYNDECDEELPDKSSSTEASTYLMERRTEDYRAVAVGIVFYRDITAKLAAHEGFHAAHFMMNYIDLPLDDSSDEAWAYLIGWIAECVDDFKNTVQR